MDLFKYYGFSKEETIIVLLFSIIFAILGTIETTTACKEKLKNIFNIENEEKEIDLKDLIFLTKYELLDEENRVKLKARLMLMNDKKEL